jgi:hypothetical protein
MNRFKDPTMRREYDAAVHQFRIKHRNFFRQDGTPSNGNSWAEVFWKGYNGIKLGGGFTDRASRQTVMYAYYRAGQDMKRADTKGE